LARSFIAARSSAVNPSEDAPLVDFFVAAMAGPFLLVVIGDDVKARDVQAALLLEN